MTREHRDALESDGTFSAKAWAARELRFERLMHTLRDGVELEAPEASRP